MALSGLSSGVTAIAAGTIHSLAIQNGAVYGWGDNSRGEIGNGTTTQQDTPMELSSLSNGVTAIAAGSNHSLAVQNGFVYAWGDNFYGEIGDNGPDTPQLTPIRVPGLSSITEVAAGAGSSYALSSNGSLWVWGLNSVGQLGLQSGNQQVGLYYFSPVQLLPPVGYRFTSIAASGASAFAIAEPVPGTSIYCDSWHRGDIAPRTREASRSHHL